jgi:hypothetical protein
MATVDRSAPSQLRLIVESPQLQPRSQLCEFLGRLINRPGGNSGQIRYGVGKQSIAVKKRALLNERMNC